MTSPTTTKRSPPDAPLGADGGSQGSKIRLARQMERLFDTARRWLASGGRPK